MNYLAHLYLSGNNPEVITGNFIADAVKGNKYLVYPQGIITGIKLHRFIDSFTDNNLTVEQSKKRLRPRYRKYAGVIVDIFYDHFLAVNWDDFSDTRLESYSADVYNILNQNILLYPEKIRYMLPFMVKHNWLYSYRKIDGIKKALEGMARRTRFPSGMETATVELLEYYESFREEFLDFFPELKKEAGKFLSRDGM